MLSAAPEVFFANASQWSPRQMDIQVLTQYEKTALNERQPLPEEYLRLPDDAMSARIRWRGRGSETVS